MLAATISRVLEKIADRRPLWDRGRIWTRGVGRGGIGVSSSRPTTMRSSSRSVARSSAASGIGPVRVLNLRSEEHTSELQSLMRISYAVFCLKKKNKHHTYISNDQ